MLKAESIWILNCGAQQRQKRAALGFPATGRSSKLALLADVSTQHLVPVLRVLFGRNGTDIEIYEAGFDDGGTGSLRLELGAVPI